MFKVAPGHIYIEQDFDFEDGTGQSKTKWYITLNDAEEDQICLVALTTSQIHKFENESKTLKPGCNSGRRGTTFLINDSSEDREKFDVISLILFKKLYRRTPNGLFKGWKNKKIIYKDQLSKNTLKLIAKCLRDNKEDIRTNDLRILKEFLNI